tara:strand:- start:19654 stop:23904 length:4251 start_codon:yes stop_codon:yes gene_type:complete
MPKDAIIVNGFAGGINIDSDLTDIITVGEGKDEVVECKNMLLDMRGKITAEHPQIISLTGAVGATCTETAAWTDGTYNVPFLQHSTSGSGTGMKIICTVSSNNVGANFKIVDGGTGHAVNDDVVFQNPSGANSNTKTFRVNSIYMNDSYSGNGQLGVVNPALGLSINASADATAERILYYDDILYQNVGIYKIGDDVNWSANGDYHSISPNRGAFNKTSTVLLNGTSQTLEMDAEVDGFDFSIEPSTLDVEAILFLGANASINGRNKKGILFGSEFRDGSAALGSTAFNCGASRFISSVRDNNQSGSGRLGQHVDYWFENTTVTTDEHMQPITDVWIKDYGAHIFGVKKDHVDTTSPSLIDLAPEITGGTHIEAIDGTGTGATTELSEANVQDLDFFVWTNVGDTKYCSVDSAGQNAATAIADVASDQQNDLLGLVFKVGNFETTNAGTVENGGYGNYANITDSDMSRVPAWEGQSINIELYVTDMSHLENIFIIADIEEGDLNINNYDGSSNDDNMKQWVITPAMITEAGADKGFARIVLTWESATHTGANYVASNTRNWIFIPRIDHNIDMREKETVRLREFSFSRPATFGWDQRYFKFYSTRISNGIESIPYEYGSTYGNSIYSGVNYQHEVVVKKSSSDDPFYGKLYYTETDSSGHGLGSKYLIGEYDYSKGFKKAGAAEFTPWGTGSGGTELNLVSAVFDDPPVISTYELESGYPYGVETINALWNTAAVVGRQAYIGNVAADKASIAFLGKDNSATYSSARYSVQVVDNGGSDDYILFHDDFTSTTLGDYNYYFTGYQRTPAGIVRCDMSEQGFEVGQIISLSGFAEDENNGYFKITGIGSSGKRGTEAGGGLSSWSIVAGAGNAGAEKGEIVMEDVRGKSITFVVNTTLAASTNGKPHVDGSGRICISLDGTVDQQTREQRVREAINTQRTDAIAAGSEDYVDVTATDGGGLTVDSTTRQVTLITANGTGAASEYVGGTHVMTAQNKMTKGFYDNGSQGNCWYFNGDTMNGGGFSISTAGNANGLLLSKDCTGGAGKFGNYSNNRISVQKLNGDSAGLANENVTSTSRRIEIIGFDSTKDDATTYYNDSLILKSASGKAAGFPDNLFIDLELGGDKIIHLVTSADRLFVFTERKLVIVNVAGDIEFLEATMDHMGIASAKQVCKVGEGVAFINNAGVYFFDGEQLQSLKDLRVQSLGVDPENCAIGYDANRSILYVWISATKVYFYSFVTQSWVGRVEPPSPFNVEPDTNVVNGKNGFSFFEQAGKYYALGFTNSEANCQSNAVHLETGKISLGNIAQNKKFYKVNITLTNGKANNMRLYWRTNETLTTYWDDLVDVDSGSDNGIWLPNGDGLNELKLSGARGKWIQLKLMSKTTTASPGGGLPHDDGNAPLDMSIGDISIIFRGRIIK